MPGPTADPEVVLDDPAALDQLDADALLPAVASAAAQVREGAALALEAGAARLRDEGRPRAVVVLGAGPATACAEALTALGGLRSAAPVVLHAGQGLPAWVGAADLVVALDASGTTGATLSGLDEATRRSARLLVVAADGSPAQQLAERGRAVFVAVPPRPERASLWALLTPLLVAGDALGVVVAGAEVLEGAAVLLEQLASRCRPDAETVLNPAKSLALSFVDRLPVVWGASPVAGVAARWTAAQLTAVAGAAALGGELPAVSYDAVGVLDGPAGHGEPRDIFADPEPTAGTPLHVVLLRDTDEPATARARAVRDLVRSRGAELSELVAEGASPVERLASLVALADWAATYLALATGVELSAARELDAPALR